MQTTISINDPNATITIEHTGEKDKVLATLEQAGLYAFNHKFYSAPEGVDPSTITWDSLNNTQRLAVFTNYITHVILEAANSQYVDAAAEAARIAALAADIFI